VTGAEDRHLDGTRAVREGEELDLARLQAYLSDAAPELAAGPLAVEQFPSGHSNLTYLIRAGQRELVLRRPPIGAAIATAHDMSREHRMLSRLIRVYPRVPRPLLYCEDADVIGAPFYLMERVRGVILRILRGARLPEGLEIDPTTMRALCTALIDNLAALHAVDLEQSGLAELGRPAGYVERQVEGWTRRYFAAKTDEIPEVERVARWLADNRPSESGAALIHGDYKYDNLVLDPAGLSRILAVLDWEMATIGDPLMDLGTTLAYWIDPDDPPEHRQLPFGPTTAAGNLTRRELVARYAEISGRDCRDVLFYFVFGLFKIVVIAQQIYQRFKKGLTKDPRFAAMIFGVQILGRSALRAIEGQDPPS
jgi:aminoglycoside phosphotransferase (APT) family kinase protein